MYIKTMTKLTDLVQGGTRVQTENLLNEEPIEPHVESKHNIFEYI